MAKLPDNVTLRRLFREGLTDLQIAKAYGCTPAAVNARYGIVMNEPRKPWSNTASAILEAAWPREEFERQKFTRFNRARDLTTFIRWRLGDPTLTERQLLRARNFTKHQKRNGVVLTLDWSKDNPWVFLPREPSDGELVIRWPEGRELPKGPHLEAISLPPTLDGPDSQRG
ncbi:hypothetical protein [Streptomyces parvus]|uniref:Uncharacterized protein n=1 Tax=Streptomyces parvus TaxID=66428 RepID=A0A7K3S0X8_9ACTN|nr:hypothetical protein [Streptomyces parvus]NEC21165.1 hypothetical protein [Streptomyces parvus]